MTERAEKDRYATLRGYGLTEDVDVASLGDLVDLAVRLSGKPMGFVSLLEDGRQWLIARTGVEVSETSTDDSICARVIDTRDVVVIEDLRQDERTRTAPMCLGETGARFYAAAPLLAPNGKALGMLAVMDHQPGTLAEDQREILRVLARQAMTQLDLHKALSRADVMRREVDHRVKNSLQSVASLTRMQSRVVESAEAREALQTVSRRIETVATLNSKLYRSETAQKLSLRPFLSSIVDLIRDSAPDHVTVEIDVSDVNVPAPHAGSLAIIVNEFATNSFKHAFPDDRPGRVLFEGTQQAPGTFRLICRDDGIGLSEEAVPIGGLGLAIIDSAVDSLSGERCEIEDPTGYGFQITFGI